MICQECGEEVEPNQKHTFQDCMIYKDKLKMIELARLQEKINDTPITKTTN